MFSLNHHCSKMYAPMFSHLPRGYTHLNLALHKNLCVRLKKPWKQTTASLEVPNINSPPLNLVVEAKIFHLVLAYWARPLNTLETQWKSCRLKKKTALPFTTSCAAYGFLFFHLPVAVLARKDLAWLTVRQIRGRFGQQRPAFGSWCVIRFGLFFAPRQRFGCPGFGRHRFVHLPGDLLQVMVLRI